MVIVDTTVWIDYLAAADTAETRWFDRQLTSQRFGLPRNAGISSLKGGPDLTFSRLAMRGRHGDRPLPADLMLCEVLQGLSSEREAELVLAELRRFSLVETGGARLAVEAARNYRVLRGHGRTIPKPIDCLIATACILGNHVLLHNDRDFDPFEQLLGLQVVHP